MVDTPNNGGRNFNWGDLGAGALGSLVGTYAGNFIGGIFGRNEDGSLGFFGNLVALAGTIGGAIAGVMIKRHLETPPAEDNKPVANYTEANFGALTQKELLAALPENLRPQVRTALEGVSMDPDGTLPQNIWQVAPAAAKALKEAGIHITLGK